MSRCALVIFFVQCFVLGTFQQTFQQQVQLKLNEVYRLLSKLSACSGLAVWSSSDHERHHRWGPHSASNCKNLWNFGTRRPPWIRKGRRKRHHPRFGWRADQVQRWLGWDEIDARVQAMCPSQCGRSSWQNLELWLRPGSFGRQLTVIWQIPNPFCVSNRISLCAAAVTRSYRIKYVEVTSCTTKFWKKTIKLVFMQTRHV